MGNLKKDYPMPRFMVYCSSWLGVHIAGMLNRPGYRMWGDESDGLYYNLGPEEYLFCTADAIRHLRSGEYVYV